MKNSAVASGLEKVSFHCNPKEGQAKEDSDYCTDVLISHAHMLIRFCSKSFKVGFIRT